MGRPSYSTTLPSEMRALSTARTFIESACQNCRLDPSLLRSLVLVTGEAVTNIVRHAHRHNASARFQIEMEVGDDAVVLSFHDEGEPFDIGQVPCMKPNEMRLGGRGVFLMRKLMDELSTCPRGHGQPGNTLRMVKRRAAVAALVRG